MKKKLFFVILWGIASKALFGQEKAKAPSYSLYVNLNQNTSSGRVLPLPGVGINYLHQYFWSLGFSLDLFGHKIDEDSFKILELSKKINFELRIYHPFYLLAGVGLSFLKPLDADGKFNLAGHGTYSGALGLFGEISFLFKSPTNPFLLKTSFRPWFSPGRGAFKGYLLSISSGMRL